VRHGETEWSKSGRHTGRTDVPLTEHGRQEARHLGVALDGRSFAHAWCSPLSRARDTFELSGVDAPVEILDDLLEWDYGDYEGVTTREIQAGRPGWSLWADGCPGGEQAADVGARVDRVIEEAVAADGDVAIFANGHVLRVLGARWVQEPPQFGGRLALSTASICVLGFEHGARVVWRWNAT